MNFNLLPLTIEPNLNLFILAIVLSFVSAVVFICHNLQQNSRRSMFSGHSKVIKKFKFHQYLHWSMLFITLVVFASSFGIEFKQKSSTSKAATQSATISLSPSEGKVMTNEVLPIEVKLNTGGEAVNAISVFLSYPTDKLEISGIDYSLSAFSIMAAENVNDGQIEISRGNLNDVVGEANVALIKFRTKSAGKATISLLASSAVVQTSDSIDLLDKSRSAIGNFVIADVPRVSTPINNNQSQTTTTSGNTSGGYYKKADFNKDGKVNILDLSMMLRNWNEPASSYKLSSSKDVRVNIFDLPPLLNEWTN